MIHHDETKKGVVFFYSGKYDQEAKKLLEEVSRQILDMQMRGST
jgi:uncharacterized membrane-anchored protein